MATYYVSNTGNDSNSGTSQSTPWRTLSKVNSTTFSAGDYILFQRGGTWREQLSLIVQSGNSGARITYGAYGTGDKPKIIGSKQENSTGDWSNVGTNLWRNTDATFTNANGGVGNLIFNNEASIGWKVYSSGNLNSQGDFYYDLTNQWLTVYSTSNPASYYTNIECALGKDAVRLWSSQDYITIENIDFRYYAAHGVSAGGGNDNITVQDCHFQYIGGGDFDGGSYGNAVQFWGTCSNILIERNTFYEIYDAAITYQYSGSTVVTISNFVVRNNIVDRAYYSWECFLTANSGSSISGMYFQNNTCVNAGGSWSDAQRPLDTNNGRHVMIWAMTSNATYSNLYLRNNIFSTATDSAIHIASGSIPYWVFDYNLYNVAVLCYDGATYTTLAQWQTARSKDLHSISANPSFVSSTDFHLSSSASPAYHTGTYVGYSTDYDLATWNNPPSIGAYEYIYSTPTVTTDSVSSITTTTAVCGGNVTHDGYLTVTGKGVCWSTSTNPTIGDNYTSDGTGEGSFISSITTLIPDTTYHVRAYAINSLGIAYGSDVEFTTEVGDGVDDYVLVSFANVCKYSILE